MRVVSTDLQRKIDAKIQTLSAECEPKFIISNHKETVNIDWSAVEPYIKLTSFNSTWWDAAVDVAIANSSVYYSDGRRSNQSVYLGVILPTSHDAVTYDFYYYRYNIYSKSQEYFRLVNSDVGKHCCAINYLTYSDSQDQYTWEADILFIHNNSIKDYWGGYYFTWDHYFPKITDLTSVQWKNDDYDHRVFVFATDYYSNAGEASGNIVNGLCCFTIFRFNSPDTRKLLNKHDITLTKDDPSEKVVEIEACSDTHSISVFYITELNGIKKSYIWHSGEMTSASTDIELTGAWSKKLLTSAKEYGTKTSSVIPIHEDILSLVAPIDKGVYDTWEHLGGAFFLEEGSTEMELVQIPDYSEITTTFIDYVRDHWLDASTCPLQVGKSYRFANKYGEYKITSELASYNQIKFTITNSNNQDITISYPGNTTTVSLNEWSSSPVQSTKFDGHYMLFHSNDGYRFAAIHTDPRGVEYGVYSGVSSPVAMRISSGPNDIFSFDLHERSLSRIDILNAQTGVGKYTDVDNKMWNCLSLADYSFPDSKQIVGIGDYFDTVTHTNQRMIFLVDAGEISQPLNPISGSIKSQVDNAIVSMDFAYIGDPARYKIGDKLWASIQFGNSEEYPMGVFYVDSIDYDTPAKQISVSSRNSIGYILNDQTFDEKITVTGEPKDLAEYVLNKFGITNFAVEATDPIEGAQFEWDASTTGLTALKDLFTMYSSTYQLAFMWTMTEAPDGTVVIGYDPFRFRYMPNTRYDFEEEAEVFSRKIAMSVDGAYSHVYCDGTDQNGDDLTPVFLPVTVNDGWNIGAHKTYHAPSLEGATQGLLNKYASDYAKELSKVGIKQTFSSPIRPQLLVGDVARVYNIHSAPDPVQIGIISEVTHTFGKDGFKTDFTLDSGGDVSYVTESGVQYAITRSLSINGDTRKKRIIDFLKK